MKRWISLIGIPTAFTLGVVSGWFLQRENLIDACLDAGGRWVYAGSYCEGVFLNQ